MTIKPCNISQSNSSAVTFPFWGLNKGPLPSTVLNFLSIQELSACKRVSKSWERFISDKLQRFCDQLDKIPSNSSALTFPFWGSTKAPLPPTVLKFLSFEELSACKPVSKSWERFISNKLQRECGQLHKIGCKISPKELSKQGIYTHEELNQRIQRFYEKISLSCNNKFICSIPYQKGFLQISVFKNGGNPVQKPEVVESCVMISNHPTVTADMEFEAGTVQKIKLMEEVKSKFIRKGVESNRNSYREYFFQTQIQGLLPLESGTAKAIEQKQRVEFLSNKIEELMVSLKAELSTLFVPFFQTLLGNALFNELEPFPILPNSLEYLTVEIINRMERTTEVLGILNNHISSIVKNPDIVRKFQRLATVVSPIFENEEGKTLVKNFYGEILRLNQRTAKCRNFAEYHTVLEQGMEIMARSNHEMSQEKIDQIKTILNSNYELITSIKDSMEELSALSNFFLNFADFQPAIDETSRSAKIISICEDSATQLVNLSKQRHNFIPPIERPIIMRDRAASLLIFLLFTFFALEAYQRMSREQALCSP